MMYVKHYLVPKDNFLYVYQDYFLPFYIKKDKTYGSMEVSRHFLL